MKRTLLYLIAMTASWLGLQAQDSALERLTIVDDVVQISSAEDLANFAQAVNEGNLTLDAVLTADIAEYSETAISLEGEANAYSGTFDGQYHTININLTTTGANWGLIRALKGTVKNLHVSGQFTAAHNRVGVIVGEIFGGTIENCWSSADIAATFGGDGAISGICGRASGAGSTIRNCVYSGNVSSGETGTYNCAGIVGWCPNPIDIINCIVTGTFDTDHSQGNARPLARYDDANNTNAQCKNCYYVDPNGDKVQPGAEQVEPETVASGALCHLINFNLDTPIWFQNLGEDPVPVPFPSHKEVYPVGNLRCDGHAEDGATLTFTNDKSAASTPPAHNYVDGVCTVCGQADPSMATLVDGYYEIGTPEQMAWFAAKVNGGDTSANGKLVADIELPASFAPIGNSSNIYAGIFDGQYHTLEINMTTQDANYGLFRALGGTVKNLHVSGIFTAANNRVGVIVGEIFGGTIESCWVSADIDAAFEGDGAIAGICGRASGTGSTIRNCVFSGNVSGPAWNCAGIVGWCANLIDIQNCLVTGKFETDHSQGNARPIARYDAANNTNANCTDCFYVNPNGTDTNINTTQVTMELVQSGEMALRLNEICGQTIWYQRIGEDEVPSPMPDRGVVYVINKIYGNAYDSESFQNFREAVIDAERNYAENVIAQTILKEEYGAAVASNLKGNNIEEFLAAWAEIEPLYQQVAENEAAYAAYKAKVEEVISDLEKNENLQNIKRDELEDYLTEFEDPGTIYANGSAPYILEERQLNTEEIKSETAKIDAMYNAALTYEPASGTDITKLLTNPDFADGFNGWEGTVGTKYGSAAGSTVRAAECYSATMDMFQTLTGLQNGVYELQVNGAFRPYPGADNLYNTNYAATLYANGNHNYFQAIIEDMIPVGEDIDGYNCDHSSDWPDFEVKDISDNVVGYVVHGLDGCCYAFQADRYFNTILCEVTDGTLTVGIRQPGTGQQPDWVGFGNLKLIYHGTMDESHDALQRVLESQAARATTILENYEYSSGPDYASYPNFSQELKDKLQALVEKSSEKVLRPNAEYYAMIQEFSDLFLQVYECKKAYINLLDQAERCNDIAGSMSDLLDPSQMQEVYDLMDKLNEWYEDGTASIEEAQKNYTNDFSFFLKQIDGIYQIATPADFIQFTTLVNGSKHDANAVLTADIDMDGHDFTAMGTNESADTYYAGTFDGQYHTLNINMTTLDTNYGIFRALSGTVKNLHVSGLFTAANNRVGVIAGEMFGGTVENCWVSANIEATYNGDGAIAGIAGRSSADGNLIRNCAFTGDINGISYNCAGIVGWCANLITIENCLVTGLFNTDQSQGNARPIARHDAANTNAACQNCYYVNPNGTLENVNTKKVTAEQLASGEVCFLLNGSQKNIQWTQTLGESELPVPFLNQSTVYIHGDLNCDGVTPKEGSEVSYANTPCTTIDEHDFVNGVCSKCGAADPGMAELKDGYYQISNVDQLLWFAAKINGGETNLNAQITADIDLSETEFPAIGSSEQRFAGILDGQNHTITINLTATGSSYGFVRYLTGTIKNLHLDGTLNTPFNKVGPFVGESFAGTLQNCWSSVNVISTQGGDGAISGLVGRGSADGTIIENCLFSGTITGDSYNSAAFIGWSGSKSTVRNSLFAGSIEVDATQGNPYVIARNPGNVTCENVYFVNPYGEVNEGAVQITAEQVANGEALALLNEGQETAQWYQAGELAIPFLSTNAIESIASDTKTGDTSIYNLMGQKVQKVQVSGIYITGGRKVFIKK